VRAKVAEACALIGSDSEDWYSDRVRNGTIAGQAGRDGDTAPHLHGGDAPPNRCADAQPAQPNWKSRTSMNPIPDDAVEKMPYDRRIHAHMTRLKMGVRNVNCTHLLAVGDHVTDAFGGPGNFVGEVVNPNAGDEQVEVRWVSDHIGPRQTTKVPRRRLVKADYAPPRDCDERVHGGNNSSAWGLKAPLPGGGVGGGGGRGAPAATPR